MTETLLDESVLAVGQGVGIPQASWQQGTLAPGAVGRFLVPDPLPDRMLFAEPLQ